MTAAARALGAAVAAVLLVVVPAAAAIPAAAAVPSSTSLSIDGAAVPVVVAGYGHPLTLAAQVTVPPSTPDGWVFFVVDGVSRRTDVAADGTATTTVAGLAVGAHRVSATFVPRDPAQQDGSTSPETVVEVAKVDTEPVIRVTGTRARRVTRVHARVSTPYGTTATGRLTVTFRERGTTARRTRGVALEDGGGRVALGRLEPGRYRVVVHYLGDVAHHASRQGTVVRVRRRA